MFGIEGIELFISAGALALSLFAVIFLIAREKNISKRVSLLENVIEDLNQQNHKLNKTLKERSIEDNIKKIVENNVEHKIAPLTQSLKEIKKIASEYRVQKEAGAKTIDYEKSVLSLYKDGKNESEIASILGLNVNQVELILTLNNPQ